MQRTHIDLFTGLGGFSIAARANGVRTIAMCEADARCQAFLAKAWPGVPVWPDVRTFGVADVLRSGCRDGKEPNGQAGEGRVAPDECGGQRLAESGRIGSGQEFAQRDTLRRTAAWGPCSGVWLLTAGVPCQPASRAGKQAGESDDRWLWPQTVALLGRIQPTWAILENPPGIGDMEFTRILSDVEAQGYDFPRTTDGTPIIHSIGACALGAPHRRMRYWIVCRRIGVADSCHPGRERPDAEPGAERLHPEHPESESGSVGDSECVRGRRRGRPEREAPGPRDGDDRPMPWGGECAWIPCADSKVRRAPDGPERLAYGLPMELFEALGTEGRQTPEECEPHRSLLGALGNSIVPQVAQVLIAAIIQAENEDVH